MARPRGSYAGSRRFSAFFKVPACLLSSDCGPVCVGEYADGVEVVCRRACPLVKRLRDHVADGVAVDRGRRGFLPGPEVWPRGICLPCRRRPVAACGDDGQRRGHGVSSDAGACLPVALHPCAACDGLLRVAGGHRHPVRCGPRCGGINPERLGCGASLRPVALSRGVSACRRDFRRGGVGQPVVGTLLGVGSQGDLGTGHFAGVCLPAPWLLVSPVAPSSCAVSLPAPGLPVCADDLFRGQSSPFRTSLLRLKSACGV